MTSCRQEHARATDCPATSTFTSRPAHTTIGWQQDRRPVVSKRPLHSSDAAKMLPHIHISQEPVLAAHARSPTAAGSHRLAPEQIQLPIRNRIFSGESWAQERRARGRLGCNANVFSVRTRHGSPRCQLLHCCALASITAASRVVSCAAARACNDPRTHQAQAHDTAQSRQHSSSRRGVPSLRQCRGRCMRASSHIHRDDQWLTCCSM
jgi:hypothetical protein